MESTSRKHHRRDKRHRPHPLLRSQFRRPLLPMSTIHFPYHPCRQMLFNPNDPRRFHSKQSSWSCRAARLAKQQRIDQCLDYRSPERAPKSCLCSIHSTARSTGSQSASSLATIGIDYLSFAAAAAAATTTRHQLDTIQKPLEWITQALQQEQQQPQSSAPTFNQPNVRQQLEWITQALQQQFQLPPPS